jgi:hypothetical protein
LPSLDSPPQRYATCSEPLLNGPAQLHRLDLRAMQGRVRAYVAVDAEFEPALVLGRGECADIDDLLCVRDLHARREARFVTELEPAEYVVVVMGADESSQGRYKLEVNLEPLGAACEVAKNRDCADATPLAIPTEESVIRRYLPLDCEFDRENSGSRFFELDLRNEAAPVGIEVDLQSDEESFDARQSSAYTRFLVWGLDAAGRCSASPLADNGLPLAAGERAGARLEPGRYALELDSPPSIPSYLRLQIYRPDCAASLSGTCAAPEDIQLVDDHATLMGHTLCNTDQLTLDECAYWGAAPERVYRLDLSNRPERVRVRASLPLEGLGFYVGLALLRRESAACGNVLHCFDSPGNGDGWPRVDAIVEPGEYLLVVEGAELAAAGRFTLQVDVSDWRTRVSFPCYGGDVESCLWETNDAVFSCWDNPLDEKCGSIFMSCGLAPSIQDCICDADPVCCDGTEDDAERCAPVFEACHFFCEDALTTAKGIDDSRIFSLVHGR